MTHLGKVLAGDHAKAFDFDAQAEQTEYSTSSELNSQNIFSKDFSVHYQSVDEEGEDIIDKPLEKPSAQLERTKSISLEAIMEEGEHLVALPWSNRHFIIGKEINKLQRSKKEGTLYFKSLKVNIFSFSSSVRLRHFDIQTLDY